MFETEGLHMPATTIASRWSRRSPKTSKAAEGHRKFRQFNEQLFHGFQPDCVITDFEPMTAYLANHHGLPLITSTTSTACGILQYQCPRDWKTRASHETIIRAMVPRPDVSLVTTFYCGPSSISERFCFRPSCGAKC